MRIKLINPVLSGRLLRHQTEGIPSTIVLPFGSVLTTKKYDFYVTTQGDEIITLVGKSMIDQSEVEILPSYKEKVTLKTQKYGNIEMLLWEITHDTDRYEAYNIIMRSHYMNTPLRGLILGLKFVDPDIQEKIIKHNKSCKLDPWSTVWSEKTGSMVGCIVLDQLIYANPKGRRNIAEDLKCQELLEGQWHKQKRDQVLDRLKVAWISRIAIDAPYRRLGMGSLLADRITKVALLKRIPSAQYVEVFTTLANDRAKEVMKNPKKAFLSKANFKLYNEALPTKELLQPDMYGDRISPVPAKKLYFYRKTDVS